MDEYGREQQGRFIGPGQFAGYMIGQFPQTRVLRDMFSPEGNVARYDTGAPILNAERGGFLESSARELVPGMSPSLSSYLTGVTIQEPDVEQIRAIRDDRLAQRESRRRNYEERLKAARSGRRLPR